MARQHRTTRLRKCKILVGNKSDCGVAAIAVVNSWGCCCGQLGCQSLSPWTTDSIIMPMVTVVAIVEVGSTLRLVAVGGQAPDLVLESAVPQCKSFRDHWRLFSDHRLAIRSSACSAKSTVNPQLSYTNIVVPRAFGGSRIIIAGLMYDRNTGYQPKSGTEALRSQCCDDIVILPVQRHMRTDGQQGISFVTIPTTLARHLSPGTTSLWLHFVVRTS